MFSTEQFVEFDAVEKYAKALALASQFRQRRPDDPLTRALARQLKATLNDAQERYHAMISAQMAERDAAGALAAMDAEIAALVDALTPVVAEAA